MLWDSPHTPNPLTNYKLKASSENSCNSSLKMTSKIRSIHQRAGSFHFFRMIFNLKDLSSLQVKVQYFFYKSMSPKTHFTKYKNYNGLTKLLYVTLTSKSCKTNVLNYYLQWQTVIRSLVATTTRLPQVT